MDGRNRVNKSVRVLNVYGKREAIYMAFKMFDLSAQPTELVHDKALQNGTVLQSFAFDNVNKHIYTVQLMAGGLKLPGESAAVSGADRNLNGDLALTQLILRETS